MRALLSVDDKTGIETLARGLRALGIEIISTGKTAAVLDAAGIDCVLVSDVTGFPEILGGRVKTLHPALHGGILARRDDADHMAELAEHQITPIDIVVCNLYPFGKAVAAPETTLDIALEHIDIGGVTLLRAAAKNFASVTVLASPDDYPAVLTELETTGMTSLETRKRLATIAFQHTALYDTAIAGYLRRESKDGAMPAEFTIGLKRLRSLRYGENPHQQAALYSWGRGGHGYGLGEDDSAYPLETGEGRPEQVPTVAGARMLQGKELSFNNLLDLDAALNCVASFTVPATVIIKHTNPCGLACADTLLEAYRHAHAGDPISAYGGILGFNREVDEATATELSSMFYEAIIAPGYSKAAMDVLVQKKNLRLLATGTPIGPAAVAPETNDPYRLDVRRISGGLLLQTPDVVTEQDIQCSPVTERTPTLEEVTDLLFAWKAVQHVKSNAIVLAKKLMIVGVGAGQMNRVYSVQIAVDRADMRARGSVLASDAYFPFADGVEAAAKAGVTAIIQPGGSIRDEESIRMANRYGIAMLVTGKRHFRH
ncbi:MAG: bifunctional phosphoribosylaminoimidazolecarboxamide formyltransferase/IMP cyclohydrolase PurH [Chloroflexi bacterium]|nr:MAG: bifunctional phosphoribosylaminoimidazolecarboxamide formyltransferase/IMP cyclohydrolase PurH [Chloroflexota bacterium]